MSRNTFTFCICLGAYPKTSCTYEISKLFFSQLSPYYPLQCSILWRLQVLVIQHLQLVLIGPEPCLLHNYPELCLDVPNQDHLQQKPLPLDQEHDRPPVQPRLFRYRMTIFPGWKLVIVEEYWRVDELYVNHLLVKGWC